MKEQRETFEKLLAFAARTERPYICRELGGMLSHIETLMTTDELFDKLDKQLKRARKKMSDWRYNDERMQLRSRLFHCA